MKSLKEYILENIDQVEIFAKYLNVSEEDINNCIDFKEKVKSPDRKDPTPSLSFKYFGTKLICNDFGDLRLRGDVFEVVGFVLGLECRNSKDFIKICTHIIQNTHAVRVPEIDRTLDIEEPTTITIHTRPFQERDYRYFYQYFIERDIISNNYFAVKDYTINGYESHYTFTAEDPCYAYVNNIDRMKLYFPFRTKGAKRFITNNRIPIECLNTIRRKNYTILIKAFKDKLLMDHVCSLLDIYDVQFIPVASESARLPADLIMLLDRATRNRIFTMFDLDKCGIESAHYYKANYGIDNVLIGRDHTTKDPTDLIKKIKLKSFLKMFKEIYECF